MDMWTTVDARYAVLASIILVVVLTAALYKGRTRRAVTSDMHGKVVIVTGSNAGLGKVTAEAMARLGAHVIMACRSESKAQEAIADIRQRIGADCKIEFMPLDLTSLASVRAFAEAFLQRNLPLHVLLNNAGICLVPYELTADGFESNWGVNFLGSALLTLLLLDRIVQSKPSRIVAVGSVTIRTAAREPSEPRSIVTYNRLHAYSNSKLALTLFTYELARRLRARAPQVAVLMADPGVASTNIHNRALPSVLLPLASLFVRTFMRTAEQGAQSLIHACTSPRPEPSGSYVDNCRALPQPLRDDAPAARRLWDTMLRQLGYAQDPLPPVACA